ncbi:hypothetical protein ACPUVO_15285 [Pseudocolwellia sp. HL-MZ19]|uniref:hypothetical protein n=1 Tax=Pseudocolwellia sp. HL-MZ19 TaxID=3400846 RepID=UPI003CE86E2A
MSIIYKGAIPMRIPAFTLLIISFFTSHLSFAQQTDEEREISKVLTQTVKVITDKLPMIIDGDTRLDSVATVGNKFIYNNTLTKYSADQMDPEQLDVVITDNVINTICPNKEMKGFIDLGVVMVYRYLGKSGAFITELSLDTKTCNK